MYEPFHDATFLAADLTTPQYIHGSTSVPAVSLSAAKTASGSIAVALVNLNPNQPISVSIAVPGARLSQVSGTLLTGAASDAHNTFENPDLVHPVAFKSAAITDHGLSLRLPAKSAVVLDLR